MAIRRLSYYFLGFQCNYTGKAPLCKEISDEKMHKISEARID